MRVKLIKKHKIIFSLISWGKLLRVFKAIDRIPAIVDNKKTIDHQLLLTSNQ